MTVNFGLTAKDYATHRAGFPPLLFDQLEDRGLIQSGERALDLATGTGTLARGLAARGLQVTALDVSALLLEQAALLAAEESLPIDIVEAPAEQTGLPTGVFDLVTAGQCWHWFDRPVVATEVRRLLRPGGKVALCHFDWVPLDNNVVAQTEALILAHNPDWPYSGLDGFHAYELADLIRAGFVDLASFSFDVAVPYSHEAWRGRIRASAGVGASLPPPGVAAFDAAHAALLTDTFPEDPLSVPHRLFVALGRAP